jgi:hypothetical protein
MPYTVSKDKGGYKVKKKSGKTVAGQKTKLSKKQATDVIKARYANENKKVK